MSNLSQLLQDALSLSIIIAPLFWLLGASVLFFYSRRFSVFLMVTGWLLNSIGSIGMRFAEFEEFSIESLEEGSSTYGIEMTPFYDVITSLAFPGFLLASVGFLWFAFQFGRSRATNSSNKSLNTDASKAGAG